MEGPLGGGLIEVKYAIDGLYLKKTFEPPSDSVSLFHYTVIPK